MLIARDIKVAVEFRGTPDAIRKAKKDLKQIRNRWLHSATNILIIRRDKHDLLRKIARDFELKVKIIHWDTD